MYKRSRPTKGRIYTCIDGTYGEATPAGQPSIIYDPETEEGFEVIARIWGDDEAQAALKAALREGDG